MQYEKFIKKIRESFPNLIIKRYTYQDIAIYARYKHGNYRCFLTRIIFCSYRKIEIIRNNFSGFEMFYFKSKDFYKALQIIDETFTNAKNKFDIVGS